MILVLSFHEYEQGTDPVIDWLIHLNADFVKITLQDFLRKDVPFCIDLAEGKVWVNKRNVTDDIRVIWYRRLETDIFIPQLTLNQYSPQVVFELQHEVEVVVEFLKKKFSDRIWMPHFNHIDVEKPEVSYLASLHKVLSPRSIITNNRVDVETFLFAINKDVKRDLIIKPIRHSGYFIENEFTYSIYTQKLTTNNVKELPERFVLTMFQECIEAEYEVRTFYLDGVFYSSAIILSAKTQHVDIKLSFKTDIIHWIPYEIPAEIAQKLDDFMRLLHLNTGSLDLLVSQDEHYLLEINPVGQYSAPSFRCNYFLEEKIAKWLIYHDSKS